MKSTATTTKGWLMPKALCLIGMVLSILVFLLFLGDLILGLSSQELNAPFKMASMPMDILFILASGALAVMSFLTFREQQ